MERVVQILAAMLTPIIAIVTTYVAVQQYRTNRLKLRHELFDQRIAVFNEIAEFLASVTQTAKAGLPQLHDLIQKTRDGHFLFGPNASAYVKSVYRKAVDLHYCETMLASLPVGTERTEIANRKRELLIWFGNQIEVARRMFANQLSLASEQPIDGLLRLGIALSIVWLTIFSVLYWLGLYVFPLAFADTLGPLYEWETERGIEITSTNYLAYVHPAIRWNVFIPTLLLPIVVGWVGLFVIPRTIRWVRSGFPKRVR